MKKFVIFSISFLLLIAALPMLSDYQGSSSVYANQTQTGEVTASSLNVRDRATLSSAVIGGLSRGSKVTISGSSGDFYKINYRNRDAFVHKTYINVQSSSQAHPDKGTITASSLNVRSGPSVNHTIIGGLRTGQTVDIEEKLNNWYKINLNNRTGYIFSDFVRVSNESTPSSSNDSSSTDENPSVTKNQPGSGTITASRLNVRSKPTTRSPVVGSFWLGRTVELVGKSGDWYEVSHNGREAYIHGDFVRVSREPSNQNAETGSNSSSFSGKGEITAWSLNIRSGATTSSNVVGSYRRGQQVELTGKSGEWYQVNYQNKEVFIHGNFVRIISDSNSNQGNDTSGGQEVLKGKTIFIDPGHGGVDPGAVVKNTIYETHFTLPISLQLKSLLEKQGAKVVMSRTSDQTISRSDRVNLANQSGADLFISVHANAFTTSSARGSEVFYSGTRNTQDSMKLAQAIQNRLVQDLGTVDRGIKEGRIQVLQTTTMPSVLAEPAFMTNDSDLRILQNRQGDIANAILKGIVDYYQ